MIRYAKKWYGVIERCCSFQIAVSTVETVRKKISTEYE